MIFRNQGSSIKKSNSISRGELLNIYGLNSYEFTQKTKEEIFVCSKSKELDLIELDQLLQTVGWSRRCLLYTSPSPRDISGSRMPSSA